MKVLCPRCGRTSVADEDVGDFPTRCRRCGALLRRRGESAFESGCGAPVIRRSSHIQRGTLAGLLIRRSASEEDDCRVIHARAGTAVRSRSAPGRTGDLPRESRHDHVRVPRQALRKAEFKGGQRALGTLSWAGLALVALVALGALVLRSQATWP